jgi:hypothetical protein
MLFLRNYNTRIFIYKLMCVKGYGSHLIWSLELQNGRWGWGSPTILTAALVAISMPRVARHNACWWMTIWMYSSQNTDGVRGCQRMIYVILVVPHYYYCYHSTLYTSSQIIKSVHYRWLVLHIIYISILQFSIYITLFLFFKSLLLL